MAETLQISPEEVIDAYRAKRKAAKSSGVGILRPGDVNREFQVALTEIYSDEEVSAYIDGLLVAKHKGVPDNRTRLSALALMLAYRIGKPVERSEVVNVNVNAESVVGLRDRLKNSPALLSALRGVIEEIDSAGAIEVSGSVEQKDGF